MEGNHSGKKKIDVKELIDFVFSWSLDDILNDNFYKDQVEKIPESFQSVQHYLQAYVLPLLEETRAELSSSMELISKAPYAELISSHEPKPGWLSCNFSISNWRNNSYNQGKEPYRTLPGDMFIITDAIPATVVDLKRAERSWTLAWVPYVNDNVTSLKFKTAKEIGAKDMHKSLYAVFLLNITTNIRIWKSLHQHGNVNIIKEILCTDSVVEEICVQCCGNTNAIFAEKLHFDLTPVLNESQRLAIVCSLRRMQCNHKSYVELIWGPPGTGKTKTVSILLSSMLKMNFRVLACAPTNVAITELALRVMMLVKEASIKNFENDAMFCSLGDLVLFGNKERLKFGWNLEDIHLDYRVDRLLECFGQSTGWKQCFNMMINFFEGCVIQYGVSGICERKFFVDFAREQFKSISLPLRRCVQILCTHLPKLFILEQNVRNMAFLMRLLHSFESVLSQDDVVSTELPQCFLLPELPPYFSGSALILSDLRRQCLGVLRTLTYSLGQVKFPNVASRDTICKFCIQNASLIFCTASSSYKLRRMLAEPLNLLVIDEAAQLKECESSIVLQLPGIRHAILIGDECQLAATVTSKVSDGAGFRRSLFERLSLMGHSKHLLNVQYRMHPSISCFPNSKFYLSKILDAPNVLNRSHVQQYLLGPMFGPYSFINVSSGREQLDDVGRSQKNLVEVAAVVEIMQLLYRACSGSKMKVTVGVISPYAAQVLAIQEKLGREYDNLNGFSVKVKSVDGFQGGEEDIIIISTVRSNSSGSIGFVSNKQRTNVALTRARHCLWILGNEATLANSGSTWEAVVDDAKVRQCFFNAVDDKDLAKAIVNVKEELGHLDDLLCQESALFKVCRWKVFISDRFGQSLGKLKSLQTKKSVIVSLLKLSTGWRPKDMNRGFTVEGFMSTVHQFEVEGWCIVWTIDIEKDMKYSQVLKVWDILRMEKVPSLVKCLSYILGTYTGEFLNFCNAKCFEGDLEIPLTRVCSSDLKRYKNPREAKSDWGSNATYTDANHVEQSNVENFLGRVRFYSLSYRLVSHLLSGRDCQQLDFLYQVTDQELEIILSPRSTFMVGRASTRTITLTTKLFQKEFQHRIASELCDSKNANTIIGICKNGNYAESVEITEEPILRQMFVTVGAKSCAEVKRHLSNLKSFTHRAKDSADGSLIGMDDFDGIAYSLEIPNSFTDVPAKLFPLILTFQKFLLMLDGTVGDSYFTRFDDLKKHFHAEPRISSSLTLQNFIRRKEVTLEKFSLLYWPQFGPHLTKNLDASTVFTEIAFHIKGDLLAGESPDCHLSCADYILLSRAHSASLSRKRKERIYSIFLDYEKKKTENREFDWADIVIDLHQRLGSRGFHGDNVDCIYVDEVQCLTLREIMLLKCICKNVYEGFIFGADTAQTLASRTGFRLRDLRALFYKQFISGSKDCGSLVGLEEEMVSDICHLSNSVHVHTGILKVAQSVIDLIFRFFPQTIDILCPEKGDASLVNGEIPVFLATGKYENPIKLIFGNTGNAKNRNTSFGAEQVVLVRDDCARREIAATVGDKSLILTIMECKALEFQDVLLYNFFGSSPIRSQWRAIHEYMKEQDMLISTSPTSFINVIQAERSDLCSELKLLYLAITRSRRRLWISENAEDISNPIFDYWRKLSIFHFRQVDDSLLQSMPVESSKAEWTSCGTKLYCEGRTEMAMMCFRRAGDGYKEKWAKATSLRADADFMHCSNPEIAYKVLREAAEIYLSLDRNNLAAQCFIELKDYEKAGTIYLKKVGQARLEDAGDLFLLAGCFKRAAEAYASGNYFAKCLSACSTSELHDLGLHFIQSWRKRATPDVGAVKKSDDMQSVEHDFLHRCACHYHELQDRKSMLKFVKSFHSMDCARAFLKSLNCFDELLELENQLGNFLEAAAFAKLKGNALMQSEFLEKSGHYKDASLVILLYVLSNSLWASRNKGWPLKPFKRREKLLAKAKLLAVKESDAFYEFVSTEASIILNQSCIISEMKRHLNDSVRQKNLRGIVLSARKILDAHLRSSVSSYEWANYLVMDLMMLSEEKVSTNCISVETLIYFWKFWREKVLSVIEYLGCTEGQDANGDLMIEEFCLNYFGVSKVINNTDTRYILLVSDADWAVRIDDRQVRCEGDLISMDSLRFFSVAKNFWCSEVVSMGIKVLGILKTLQAYSVQTKLAKLCQSKTALEIFHVADFLKESKFLESFIDCETMQKVVDMGLEAIIFLKNGILDLGDVDMQQKMDRRISDFLEKCALHCYTVNDKRSMMKFVKEFRFMDSKRSFPKSFNCLDELLLLEEESGNLVKAAAIARQKGDLKLEIDMLEKAGHNRDAAILILSYVLANSLWASGSKVWPLKQFQQTEDLLTKAKTLAYKESGVFYEFVCAEIVILGDRESSLSELNGHFSASRKACNIIGEILSVRKILDAHISSEPSKYEWEDDLIIDLENHSDRISKCQVSIGTLVYFWRIWKEKLLNVFEYLQNLKTQDSSSVTDYERLSLSFLGVRKQFDEQNRGSLLIDSAADWIKVTDDGHLKLVYLDAQFVTGAERFWSSEIYTVGLKVLEILNSLHIFSLRNSFSLFRQCTAGIHVFEVAKFLAESKFLESSRNDEVITSFLQRSTESFFENVFPLEWTSLTENMMTLRRTKLSEDVFEEIILKSICSENKLTYGRIGKVLMLMFGSGKISTSLCAMIAERFDVNPLWKAVIHEFNDHTRDSRSADRLESGKPYASCKKVALVSKLHDALSATVNIDWRKELDFVSPNCLLYLVERFLLLVSHNEECFFTTKSSFIEWFICQELDACPITKSSITGAFDFVACTIQQLLSKKTAMVEWIERSNISLNYYPHLVFRLVILICLLCLNSGKYFDVARNLVGRIDISSHLPMEFLKAFEGKGKRKSKLLNALGNTLAKIGNPLVIVRSKDDGLEISCPDAICIHRREIHHEELLRVLFSKNAENNQEKGFIISTNTLKVHNFGHSLKNSGKKWVEVGKNLNPGCPSSSPKVHMENKFHITTSPVFSSVRSPSPSDSSDGNSLNDVLMKPIQSALRSLEVEIHDSPESDVSEGSQMGMPKVIPSVSGIPVQIKTKTVLEISNSSIAPGSQKKLIQVKGKAKEEGSSGKDEKGASGSKTHLVWKLKQKQTT